MFTAVYLHLPIFTHVYSYLPMFTDVYPCLLLFTYIYPYVYPCLPPFINEPSIYGIKMASKPVILPETSWGTINLDEWLEHFEQVATVNK